MFQTFDNIGNSAKARSRLAALRREMKRRDLGALLVPRTDEYQNEYVPACAERLAWLTGFTGSAGVAIVLADKAALFVDGRYTLQAPDQTDTRVFDVKQTPETTPIDWLKKQLKKGAKIGYDPRLHSIRSMERLEKAAGEIGADLVAEETNLVDLIWDDRPAPPAAPVSLHAIKFAGVESTVKFKLVQKELRKAKVTATVLTMPESIAWLFNIRGQDVPHTPLPLSFAIVPAKGKPQLFVAPKKLSNSVRSKLTKDADIRTPHELEDALEALGKNATKVRLDPETASQWFAARLKDAGAEVMHGPDPCMLPKSKKNKAEIEGARTAHKRDGAAMCRFLAWLDHTAPNRTLDEIAAVKKLEALRARTGELKDISFDTISGAGANGAIVHYRVTRKSNAKLKPRSLYLVDSGAQYVDGTTDITRTIAVGAPTGDMRRHYTLVLKGHIAISDARFPKGTRGADLDSFARSALWKAGLDFDHGTGHGVGSYLSVHEGPQRISKLGRTELAPGMILSNEPGYYRQGEYGIRIENLVLVTPLRKIKGGDRPMMGFETLTLAPYDRRLIDTSLLTKSERKWVDAYHARLRREIGPLLKGRDKVWLGEATAPLEDA
jgi:Xaa-Pro aminopeptidase